MSEAHRSAVPDRAHPCARMTVVLLVGILTAVTAVALVLSRAESVSTSAPHATTAATVHTTRPEASRPGAKATAAPPAIPPAALPTTMTTPPSATEPAVTPKAAAITPPTTPEAAVVTSVTEPSVATLVAEVEAAGVDPGPTWSWSMGDTAAQCGVPLGVSVATGCTFGAAGLARSVFAGSPTLALVAHEVANAETENDAEPSLMNEVTAAEAGTSWSPIDAVASCLVTHFIGIQDDAAGSWQCPAALATLVADNIHDAASATISPPS
jgi:hypothetical protein